MADCLSANPPYSFTALSEAVGFKTSVPMESIDCVLSLREVYDKVLDDGDNN